MYIYIIPTYLPIDLLLAPTYQLTGVDLLWGLGENCLEKNWLNISLCENRKKN
jgi:hypothetical protein